MAIRAKQAGEILGLSANTIRKWCDQGKLEYSYSVSGQKIFDKEYLEKLALKANPKQEKKLEKIYYVRSSTGNDVTIETQEEKLTTVYGAPLKIYKDKASGLNENRSGLKQLIKYCKEHPGENTIYITNKDRLTRFGYKYLEELFDLLDTKIIVLDSDETKEPHEILMQDFMSLIASFSGKFYRLRGWKQKKELLTKALEEVNTHEQE